MAGVVSYGVLHSVWPDELPRRLVEQFACLPSEERVGFERVGDYGGGIRIVMDSTDTSSILSISAITQMSSLDPADYFT